MLYNFLIGYAGQSHIANLFSYITFRSCLAFLFSFIVSLVVGKYFIKYLKKIQVNTQPIREDGPKTHLQKVGTPTMGGVIIISATTITTLLLANLTNAYIWTVLFVMISFGSLGAIDDYQKIMYKSSDGISGKCKLFIQFFISIIAFLAIYYFAADAYHTKIAFPFFKNVFLDLGYFYFPFAMVVITGASNAVNLTDGLDGLAAGTVAVAVATFGVVSYIVGHVLYAQYLQIIYVPYASEVSVLCCAIVGSCLGFLWFNAKPASIFMGDTGSLSLGATLGTISVITKNELVLVIIGGVFVVETLSVIIQVLYFRMTGGRRYFLMAPIHHHFEQKGWSETQVVTRFWIISILLAIIGLASLKLR
ncbi:MAG: hypothetical protein DGJ47_000577 [Rickettsiaceae bacterium]